MANNTKKEQQKKNTTSSPKKTSTNTKKSNTTKKNTNVSTTKKATPTKKNTTPKKQTKTPVKKTATKKTVSKKEVVKKVELTEILDKTKNIDIVEDFKVKNSTKHEIEIVNDTNVIETRQEVKLNKKKNKKLLAIGIFIVLLGIVALLISLVANRIIDREFMSDSTVTLMMTVSIIIEGFGAFIIINES